MSLQYGIVGLPNVGKSTLFNTLSESRHAIVANFPFCTIEPNIGVVQVPDSRLDGLARLVHPEKVIPTDIRFVDIAGLVKGASQGEGLGNQFLAHIREVDAIIHVIRCFDNDEVVHVAGQVDPVFDKSIIDYELQAKDLETLQKRSHKLQKLVQYGDKTASAELTILQQFQGHLTSGENARSFIVDGAQYVIVNSWQLLTNKPVLYVANVDEETLQSGTNAYVDQLVNLSKSEKTQLIMVCASFETELQILPPEEQQDFRNAYGLAQSGLDALIKTSYNLLKLITYFTAGPKEVRAWTIVQGTLAPQAAGIIHSDFTSKFIKAEVIKFTDYIKYGSESACRDAGKLHIEGRRYVVEDGDVMHFRVAP